MPELLSVVHLMIESKDGRRFVLTGSSARKLRRGGVDLLAGRAVLRTLHPFMASELERFDLQAALTHGMLPLVVAAERPDDVLRAYASLYLDQEVRLEGWARNVGAFARFLEVMAPHRAQTHGGDPALRSSRRSAGVPTARTVRRGVDQRGASPPSVRRWTFTTGC